MERPAPERPALPTGSAPRGARDGPRLLDWIFTLPFLVLFALILLVFDVVQRLANLFGWRAQQVAAGALQVAIVWAFRLCGTRLEVERAPEVKPHTPYLVVANHQSSFDIPVAGSLLFSNHPKYVSKRENARWVPSIAYNLRHGGHALIDRDDREGAMDAIRALGRRAQARGVSALIYPEGTRRRRGELGTFKPAGAVTLMESAPQLAIVPMVIDESWRLMRFDMLPVRFGTRVRVHIGAPIERRPGEDPLALLGAVREHMEGVLARWRGVGGTARERRDAPAGAAPGVSTREDGPGP